MFHIYFKKIYGAKMTVDEIQTKIEELKFVERNLQLFECIAAYY
jgi:hypothetical protein